MTNTHAARCSTTIINVIAMNANLRRLWRNSCCPTSAPGQPQKNASPCNVFSGIRRRPSLAQRLSQPYALKAPTLIADQPLPHPRAWPAPAEREPVQRLLRDPPAAEFGAALIPAVRTEGDDAHDAVDRE